MITQVRLKELIVYTPETGVFTWKVRTSNCVHVGDIAGSCHTHTSGKSYREIGIAGKLYRAHRLAWLYTHGHFPPREIDHINGDGTDNRLCNLRSVTPSENQRNSRLRSDNSSGTSGVSWQRAARKWVAQIKVDSKSKHLGLFEDLDDAIAARKAAEIEHGFHQNHGESRPL